MFKARTISRKQVKSVLNYSTLTNFSDDAKSELKICMPKTEGDSFEALVWAFNANAAEHKSVSVAAFCGLQTSRGNIIKSQKSEILFPSKQGLEVVVNVDPLKVVYEAKGLGQHPMLGC